MGLDFLASSQRLRNSQRRRRSWQQFWLAFSLAALLFMGTLALMKSFRATADLTPVAPAPAVPPANTAPPEFFATPTPEARLPDMLHERPEPRTPPEAVNAFLQEEENLNSGRLNLLHQRQVEVEAVDFTAHCLPQWDFRTPKREVIWFYYYTSGATPEGRLLTVFGAVDGLGQPLFQHPPMAGDPLALLDSQYTALKWIPLDEPRVALIAATNGPWPRCGAVVDIFLVNRPATEEGLRFWRFDDASYAEQPPRSARLVSFRDADGDGRRDLCAFWLTGDTEETSQATALYKAFSPEVGSFSNEGVPVPTDVLAALEADFRRILAGEEPQAPSLLAAPATEQIFPSGSADPDLPAQDSDENAPST